MWETTGPASGTGRLPSSFLSSSQVVLTKVAFSQGDILDTHPQFSLHPHEWASKRERMPFTSVSAIEGLHAWQSDLYFLSPHPTHPPLRSAPLSVCLISLTLTHVGQGTSFKLTLARTEADWCCPKTHTHTRTRTDTHIRCMLYGPRLLKELILEK